MISILNRSSSFFKLSSLKILYVPRENIYISTAHHGTHTYRQDEFTFDQIKRDYVLERFKDINDIRSKTNCAIRLADTAEANEDGKIMTKLFVIGSEKSRKKAFELLNEFMNEQYSSKDTKRIVDRKDKLLWHGYKRNFKGQYAPLKPRKRCIRCGGKILSGNPCPLCQMKLSSNYEVHYTDIEILNQFICPHTWNILDPYETNICKYQHLDIVKAITKARNHGLIPFTLPLHTNGFTKFKPAGVPTDKLIKVKKH